MERADIMQIQIKSRTTAIEQAKTIYIQANRGGDTDLDGRGVAHEGERHLVALGRDVAHGGLDPVGDPLHEVAVCFRVGWFIVVVVGVEGLGWWAWDGRPLGGWMGGGGVVPSDHTYRSRRTRTRTRATEYTHTTEYTHNSIQTHTHRYALIIPSPDAYLEFLLVMASICSSISRVGILPRNMQAHVR